ncbi:MAG: twin-arginine translocase TatA/TatE family subunit [Cyclobacteriaceae bacterium]
MNTVFAFLGMPGGLEWLVLGLVVVVFFGAKRIPEIARGFGKGIREFKDATKDIKKEIDSTGNTEREQS